MLKRNLPKILFIISSVFLWTSCDSNRVYEEFTNLDAEGWNVDVKPSFSVSIDDTAAAYNLIFHVRNHKDYPYRNVWVSVQTQYPDGSVSLDSMNLFLSDENGRELGKCSSGMCENAFFMNKRGPVKFPYNGTYNFTFEHLMRTDNKVLPHISNIGLRVEKATNNK